MVDDPRIAIAARWFNIDEWSCKRLLRELDAATPRPAADGARPTPPGDSQSFQVRVHDWMIECFGAQIAADIDERNHRFLEEALELTQANGCTASEAHQLVDYVFARPIGDIGQEVGGVTVTLAALCNAVKRDFKADGETELRRVWTMVDKIRAKQAAKPKHSPLPGISADPFAGGRETPPQTPEATWVQRYADNSPRALDLGRRVTAIEGVLRAHGFVGEKTDG